jgi:hypothetical protein
MQNTFMHRLAIVLLVALTSGCASKVISSNSRSVVVYSMPRDLADGQNLADGECRKHNPNTVARIRYSISLDTYAYDCIDK